MTEPPQDDRWHTPGGPPSSAGPGAPPPFPAGPHPPQEQYPPRGQYPPPGRAGPHPGPFEQQPGRYRPPPAVLKPVRGLGTAAVVLAAVVTGGELLGGLTGFGYSSSAWSAYDTVTSLTALVWLASFVVTCLWLTRVRRNAELLAPTFHHRRARGWAWAGWLVPVVSFWFPLQVVRDAVTASATAGDPTAPRPARPPFALWWGTWLAGLVLTNAAAQQTTSGLAAQGSTIGPLHLLGALSLVVSLVAWRRIVRTAQSLQQAAG